MARCLLTAAGAATVPNVRAAWTRCDGGLRANRRSMLSGSLQLRRSSAAAAPLRRRSSSPAAQQLQRQSRRRWCRSPIPPYVKTRPPPTTHPPIQWPHWIGPLAACTGGDSRQCSLKIVSSQPPVQAANGPIQCGHWIGGCVVGGGRVFT